MCAEAMCQLGSIRCSLIGAGQHVQKENFTMSDKNSVAGSLVTEGAEESLLQEYAPHPYQPGEIVLASILSLAEKEVLLDLGGKADGVLPRNELRDFPAAKPGDTIKVLIESVEDKAGNVVVSKKKAAILEVWQRIFAARDNQEVLEVLVTKRTSGGLEVDIDGVKGFLPGSQIDLMPVTDFESFVHQRLQVQVLPARENARSGRNKMETVIVSRRALLEAAQRELIEKLEVGDVLEGTVKNLTKFGAFVELASGIIGLVHIREAVWDKRVSDPVEARDAEGKPLFRVGGKVTVLIKGFEEQEGDGMPRISLSTKGTPEHPLLPNPWHTLPAEMQAGSVVTGKVQAIKEKGVLLEVAAGLEGFIPASELSHSVYSVVPGELVKPGDELTARIMELDREAQEMRLSVRQTIASPWESEDFHQKYALDTRHQAIVRRYADKQRGTYLELEPGVEAYLDNEHISWTENLSRASDKLAIGDTCEVIVLGIKESDRQLLVGMRELSESPWTTFEEVFPVGSIHKAAVKRVQKHGAIVELPFSLEVFIPSKELVRQDGTKPEAGEVIDVRVLEFDRQQHLLVVSHLATYQQRDAQAVRKAAQPVYTVEKATFSDVDALTKLREEMGRELKKKSTKKKEEDTE